MIYLFLTPVMQIRAAIAISHINKILQILRIPIWPMSLILGVKSRRIFRVEEYKVYELKFD